MTECLRVFCLEGDCYPHTFNRECCHTCPQLKDCEKRCTEYYKPFCNMRIRGFSFKEAWNCWLEEGDEAFEVYHSLATTARMEETES